MSVQAALTRGPFSLRDLAAEAGVSYHAIRAYAYGRRTPDPDTAARLARVLAARGETIRRLADDLERAAGE